MKKSFLTIVAILALFFSAGMANAADVYLHSGDKTCVRTSDDCSVMSVGLLDNDIFVISYLKARQGLEDVGVVPGTLLVSGRIVGNRFYGQATRFSRIGRSTCMAKYDVTGIVTPNQDFELTGAAPVFAQNECRVLRYTRDSAQARLFFLYMGKASDFRSTSN